MIRLTACKLPVTHTEQELGALIEKRLGMKAAAFSYRIVKRSVDARQKPTIFFQYTIDIDAPVLEKRLSKKRLPKDVQLLADVGYQLPHCGDVPLSERPIVVGTGPAGLFCGYLLARLGYRPLMLERGEAVEDRKRSVEHFWQTGELDPASNVQFGEGGAGTFSDGKLNTLTKDHHGRSRQVLETFVRFGAPEEILYDYKPHIGTDRLQEVIPEMRRQMQAWGAQFCFSTCLTGITVEQGKIKAVTVTANNEDKTLPAEVVVMAPGHSARDTFRMLHDSGLPMEAKAFAVGYRVEHPQSMIDLSQYGVDEHPVLGAAPYKLTYRREDENRGVYSFCMCPGGYVVNASSQPGRLVVNGMSYYDRAGLNANSAIITSVSTADFGAEDALAGVRFQEQLEERAFALAQGAIPVQYFKDFCSHSVSCLHEAALPQMKGCYQAADVSSLLPASLNQGIVAAMHHFAGQIPGFDGDHVIFSGIESRTSSPVRLLRNKEYESKLSGLFPCGEGAGYAGGIMSAAIDGLKVAETIIRKYRPSAVAD